MEQPELFVEELRAFFRLVRRPRPIWDAATDASDRA